MRDLKTVQLNQMEIPERVFNLLKREGCYDNVYDVHVTGNHQLLGIPQFGVTALKIVRDGISRISSDEDLGPRKVLA